MSMDNMTIADAKYVSDPIYGHNLCIQATINDQELSVPLDAGNRHYAEVMRQVEAGTLVVLEA
jgi:hypothetical protein